MPSSSSNGNAPIISSVSATLAASAHGHADELELTGWQARAVQRQRGGTRGAATDAVADECPVALVFNGISHAVMMCTPRDLEAFAVGFALTEGIVARSSDIHDIEVGIVKASAGAP